ncbi:GFA family protein [Paracoccus sp. Z118]|uniref:GFA family protein n=1 Tax=Paracoccus sp. Z118 TaxID=2851017 RepID=UPI001C2CC014|nr:GFA family protein [Paracoccus sp. Z118]MBV0890465.1 GFA family protein [Paracoccus sp. Z118]
MTSQSYTGSCQCGAIAFEVDADLDHTVTCNCSRCRRLGWVLTFVPASAFRLTKDGPTTEYLFNKHIISHRFCPTCGVEPYARGEQNGEPMVAVNVNCLDGVDARALNSTPWDGASA